MSDLDAGNDSLFKTKYAFRVALVVVSLYLREAAAQSQPASQQPARVHSRNFSFCMWGDDRMSPFLYDAGAITLLAAFVSVVVCFCSP